jgi:hypothetical protein
MKSPPAEHRACVFVEERLSEKIGVYPKGSCSFFLKSHARAARGSDI